MKKNEQAAVIGGNVSIPLQGAETPLERWKEEEYYALHNQIMAHGRNACESLLNMARDMKRMNDEKLYISGGYASFEDYAEKAVGLKKSQAYKYISAYEEMGEEYFHSNGKLGITKINLLAGLTEQERNELEGSTDLESATVKELRAKIAELRGEVEEKENKIAELEWNAAAEEISENSTRVEKSAEPAEKNSVRVKKEEELEAAQIAAEQARAEAERARKAVQAKDEEISHARADAEALREQIAKLETEKSALEEKLKSPRVERVENPETAAERDKARAEVAEKEKEIEQLNKKLRIAGDETLTKFKILFNEWQNTWCELQTLMQSMGEEVREKSRAALQAAMQGWQA